jgi:hypothetical protein
VLGRRGLRRLRLLLVLLPVVAAVAVAAILLTGGHAATPPTANVWVATGAGDCKRAAEPAPFAKAAACSSLAAAYVAARGGDRVLVRPGRYGAQTIRAKPGFTGPPIVVEGESRARVVLASVAFDGTTDLTLRSMTVRLSGAGQAVAATRTRDLTLDRMTLDSRWTPNDTLKLLGGTSRTTISRSDLCCVADDGSGGFQHVGGAANLVEILDYVRAGANTGVTFVGDRLHGHRRTNEAVHTEAMLVWGMPRTRDLTIDRTRIVDYAVTAINTGNGIDGAFVLRNSVIAAPALLDPADRSDPGAFQLTDGCDPASSHAGWVWEYNQLGAVWRGCDAQGGMTLRANVGVRGSDCDDDRGQVQEYNVWVDNACSPTDVKSADALDGGGVDRGDPRHFPKEDIRGVRRPRGRAPDAGPFER